MILPYLEGDSNVVIYYCVTLDYEHWFRVRQYYIILECIVEFTQCNAFIFFGTQYNQPSPS